MTDKPAASPPILRHKQYHQPSLFLPENLLREARRQKAIPPGTVPPICILDPDGDILRHLIAANRARLNSYWACYHTQLYDFELEGLLCGIIGCAVGASFAVLVSEELFASGCRLVIDVTSSGQITPKENPPYFILIEQALRDEGTSYHYLPPSDYAAIEAELFKLVTNALPPDGQIRADVGAPIYRGATWTTDAPFRETTEAIEQARAAGILAVEMEAAALYAFAQARQKPVVCFAHVTNQMGNVEGDFEKGEAGGSRAALRVIAVTAQAWLAAG